MKNRSLRKGGFIFLGRKEKSSFPPLLFLDSKVPKDSGEVEIREEEEGGESSLFPQGRGKRG